MRKSQAVQKAPFPLPDVVTKLVPAPTDGWDAITPLALMDPKRAVVLDNWVPRTGWVELRAGYQPYSQRVGGSTTAVETLAVLRAGSTEHMLAASAGNLVDVSSPSATVTVASGLSNNRWQYVNFRPAGGTPVIQLVNGADALQQWDGGAATTQPAITGLPAGVTTASFTNIFAQKRRLWYLVDTSMVAIFMPTDAVTGPIAGTLDLGALFTAGGYVLAMADWTVDGGTGPQDYAAFISSRGQVAVYQGTDPTNAAAWSLVGVFTLSPPLGRRCTLQVGSDVALITLAGVLPLSQALPFDPSADRSVAITQRIQNAMQQSAMQGQDLFGWQLTSFPAQSLAILNVPQVENSAQVQYVMNTLSGAWCRFTGWNANCFTIFNDNLYWGGNSGDVNQGYEGSTDFTASIQADMQCAYNYFEDPGREKRMTMIQPLLVAGGTITPTLEVDADFGVQSNAAAPLQQLSGSVLWDVAVWDQAVWPPATQTLTNWYSANAVGHALAVRMKVNVGNTMVVTEGVFDVGQFDYAVFDGGFLSGVTLQVNAFNVILEMGAYV